MGYNQKRERLSLSVSDSKGRRQPPLNLMQGRRYRCRRLVLRKVLRNNTTQPSADVLPLCLPDPVSQVGIDPLAKSTLCAVLHANYILQELGSVNSTHGKWYYLIDHAVPKEDWNFFGLI
jgi:hypothetical protein